MLNLKRREGESIVVDNGAIVVTVLEIHSTWVKLGWEAAREIPIHRKERQEEIEAAALKGGIDGPR